VYFLEIELNIAVISISKSVSFTTLTSKLNMMILKRDRIYQITLTQLLLSPLALKALNIIEEIRPRILILL